MNALVLGSPQVVPAVVSAVVGAGFVGAIRSYTKDRNPRRYEPKLAWMRACAYFAFAWALGFISGAVSTIAQNPMVFPGQIHNIAWWIFTLVAVTVVVVGYWIIWPIGTRAHGRKIVIPETPIFGILWGLSEGMIFASVFVTADRIFGVADLGHRLAVFATCYLALSLFIGLWHAIYWDIYIAPEHNVLEWNIRKVILAHNPNVTITTAYVIVFGNVSFYVLLQAIALFGATLAMPFPSFRHENPEVDPDNPPRRDVSGLVCVLTGVGSSTITNVATDLAEVGAKVVLVTNDVGSAQEIAQTIARWTLNTGIDVVEADLTTASGAQSLAERLVNAYGGVDVLVDDWAGADKSGDVRALIARHKAGLALQEHLVEVNPRELRIIVVGAEDHRGVERRELVAVAQGAEVGLTLPTLSAVRIACALGLSRQLGTQGSHATVQVVASGNQVGNSTAEPSGAAAFFSTIFQSNLDPALSYVQLVRSTTPAPATGGYWTNCQPQDVAEVVLDEQLQRELMLWSGQ